MSGSITPTPPNGAQAPAPKGQVVQIVSLPEGLENTARAMRIEGDVVQQNKDGSVRVRTEYGDIDIQVRGRQPQPNTKIEIEIPAGHPPKQATIRPAPQQPAQQPPPQVQQQPAPQTPLPQQPAPPQTDAEAPNVQPQPAPRPSAPAPQTPNASSNPVDTVVTTKPAVPTPPVQTAQPSAPQSPVNVPTTLPPLSTGQSVQILPLSPADGIEQAIPDALTAKTSVQTAIIAQKAQGNLISTMLQAVKSVLPNMSIGTTQIPSIPPQTLGMAQPSTIVAETNVLGAQAKLPAVPLPTAPVTVMLGAQIVSVTPPLGQRIFVPQAATQIVPTTDTPIGKPAAGIFTQTATQPVTVNVEQASAQNKPVISIPMNNGTTQTFVLQASAATTPPGTQVTILPQLTLTPALSPQAGQASAGIHVQPQIPAASVSSMPPAWRALLPLMQPAPIWPVIDELFQTFYQTTPQAAQILGRVIPSPANAGSFGPAALLFIAAVKSGDIQGWLGDKKLDMIQKLGKASLVSRLAADTAHLSQNADAPATDWKSYPFPLLHQNEISKVMLHLRREPDENEKDRDKDATHFVMDVALTRMGNVQLDALVRGNRVDLVVRTELPVSSSMQDAMRTAYAQALDNTNIYGDIGFQSDIRNFVRVVGREEALASA